MNEHPWEFSTARLYADLAEARTTYREWARRDWYLTRDERDAKRAAELKVERLERAWARRCEESK